jgi:Icc-related predicted phosphoesterase
MVNRLRALGTGHRALATSPSLILLCFSDLHRDLAQCARLVDMSADADVVIAAGDFASIHKGLDETIGALRPIERPTVLVPGNNETEDALRSACDGWPSAMVLHGEGADIDGVSFFGLGAGVPTTPWDWSFDLSDDEAAERLAGCPEDGVLVVHSPPKGHLDGGFGSEAILRTIEDKRPRLAVFGHIHECAGRQERLGPTLLANLGPDGMLIDV